MIADRSAWRANDAVAYDALSDAASAAIATLFQLADEGILELTQAVREATEIRREVLDVDGYDRDAVDAERESLEQRTSELRGRSS
ncbi:hypothetical protein [Microbacterium sp. SS28]|uniref:hypothetical protein n=1 Tax=Microbacterium sp. SS28 TaxID=2919948 RepID=UPI001FA974C2|nr:hypothetical protein [Microbacterium sp. SS28]